MAHNKVVILGSGPAGLTAAIYAGRANLNPVVIAGHVPGGQLTITTDVENFPGYPEGVQGPDMMDDLRIQAERFGADIINSHVVGVRFGDPHVIELEGGEIVESSALVIATGASAKWLELENEKNLLGRGVSACATCDGFFFKDRVVAVVGGGDTAMEEALFLTKFASRVILIHRRDEFRASQIMQDRVRASNKIEVVWNTVVTDVLSSDGEAVEGVLVKDVLTEDTSEIAVGGLFIAIGHSPNTDIFSGVIDMDNEGYIKVVGPGTQTNIPGVFVSGDAADNVYRQAITAAGTGCMAAIDAERWLTENE
ncbi:MAG: thioredoxin-disulfide reductase [Euryarchaeota archaeon]|nr:thioredoxin-disulfide reductase [Euryarchaeota archaeon]|tara:strand:- start:219 stop:1148 length:930 start_codon:yes stop_codon:yes gene_type:complete